MGKYERENSKDGDNQNEESKIEKIVLMKITVKIIKATMIVIIIQMLIKKTIKSIIKVIIGQRRFFESCAKK